MFRANLVREASNCSRGVYKDMVVGASISVEGVDSGLAIDDSAPPDKRGDIRIWMDGAFDMMHFGHMNAFRQGRALGK